MKKFFAISFLLFAVAMAYSQNATQAKTILDKTAAIIGRKGGASASFTISNVKVGSTTGTIAIKGNKFHARTPQAMVWYDGKTQWSYMKSTNEVNISNPTEAQRMTMNPYQFINMYKSGYTLGMKDMGAIFQIHMTAQNTKRSVQEMYILINKKTYVPTQIKMRQGNDWSTITISNFQAKDQRDNIFVFRSKDFPTAEVIDLR